jgi:hypothetical protein
MRGTRIRRYSVADAGDVFDAVRESMAELTWISTGGAIAGAGVAMLVIGNAKRGPAPALALGARRVSWRLRF